MSYTCVACNYTSIRKQNFDKHLNSSKHKMKCINVVETESISIIPESISIIPESISIIPEPDTYNVGICHEITLPYIEIIQEEYHRIYYNYPNKFRYVKYMRKAKKEIRKICDDNRYKKWEKNNAVVNLDMYKHKFSIRMAYILVDIRDLYAKPIGS
jgi:hypothetical protein